MIDVTAGAPMRRMRRQVIPGFGAEEIVRARMRLGLTQDDMAEKAGVPLRTYAGWERGESIPSAQKLGPLITFLESHGINPRDTAKDDTEAGILRDPLLSEKQKADLIQQLRAMREGRG